ncbi:facilitated trehalose transporter Tret1-like [Maniola hyperantus]|uniref:facilitated trehalose transporter Tret1-like n=1 Tax=Aphantopus hyperantus TaxID=2795564 RepID=UPI003747DB81
MNPDILSPNGTIHVTPDQAAWIAASTGISGVLGFCTVPYIMQIYGRKIVHIAINICTGVGFLIFALANNVPCLYAARTLQGSHMCMMYVGSIMMGEYSHPKRRGYFIILKKFSAAVGSLICHSMALWWTWKKIAAFAIIPPVIAVIMTFMWPESPAFLALKGRYDECDKSHTWLHGDSLKNKKELDNLIATQTERREKATNKRNVKTVIKNMMKKDFMLPFITASMLTLLIDASGRYYTPAYVVQILTEITKDKSIAVYCTIGADTLTVIALLISCYIIRCFKRRTLIFTAGITSVFLMCLISLVAILKTRHTIGGSALWITPSIILLNIFVVNVGIVPVCFAIIGEIFPLEHKGTGSFATGIVFTILFVLVMKFTPLMMEKTGVEGTFGIYGLHMILALLILYFTLNETKDKTLQEIENEIKGIS